MIATTALLTRSWVFRTWREYFHFSYLTEAELDPKKTYVFVGFPHGVFPMGGLIGGEGQQHLKHGVLARLEREGGAWRTSRAVCLHTHHVWPSWHDARVCSMKQSKRLFPTLPLSGHRLPLEAQAVLCKVVKPFTRLQQPLLSESRLPHAHVLPLVSVTHCHRHRNCCSGPLPHAGTAFQSEWPFFRVPGLGASSVFSIPMWRHFLTWIGIVEATPGNYKRLLQQGSVAISVGGIAEMYMQVCASATRAL